MFYGVLEIQLVHLLWDVSDLLRKHWDYRGLFVLFYKHCIKENQITHVTNKAKIEKIRKKQIIAQRLPQLWDEIFSILTAGNIYFFSFEQWKWNVNTI